MIQRCTMLLLCSNGLTGSALPDALAPHTARCKTAALVVTADDQYKAANHHVPRCIEDLRRL